MRVKIGFTCFNQSKTIKVLVVCTDGCTLTCWTVAASFPVNFTTVFFFFSSSDFVVNKSSLSQRKRPTTPSARRGVPTPLELPGPGPLPTLVYGPGRGWGFLTVRFVDSATSVAPACASLRSVGEGDDGQKRVNPPRRQTSSLGGGLLPFSNANGRCGC